MDKKLLYFGCIGGKEHYLWPQFETIKIPGINSHLLQSLDGTFTPGNTNTQGLYQVSIVPPVMIVSWHDYSVDSRPGSHSTFIGYGYLSAQEIIEAAKKLFPDVMSRQPEPKPLNP